MFLRQGENRKEVIQGRKGCGPKYRQKELDRGVLLHFFICNKENAGQMGMKSSLIHLAQVRKFFPLILRSGNELEETEKSSGRKTYWCSFALSFSTAPFTDHHVLSKYYFPFGCMHLEMYT